MLSASKLRYLEFKGEGVPLLMIHGLGCASSFEYPHVALAPSLRGRHLFLIDLLGFGYSDRPEDFGYRVEDHAQQIYQFVEEQGFDQVDIYGHSMGGSIAVEAADLLEAKIKHLIVSEANLDSGGGQFSRLIAALGEAEYLNGGHVKVSAHAHAAGYPDWAATMRVASPLAVHRGAMSLVEGSTSLDWRSRFLRHPARKTYIFGAHSLPDPDTEILSSKGIQVLVVPDAGHGMSLENPHGLATAIAGGLSDPCQS